MKIYLDVTETEINKLNTGIQRVVREVVGHVKEIQAELDVEVVPVVARGGHFFPLGSPDRLYSAFPEPTSLGSRISSGNILKRLVKQVLRAIPFAYPLAVKSLLYWRAVWQKMKTRGGEAIRVKSGDVLLLLDSFWGADAALQSARKFELAGGHVYVLIYDMIPILYPQYYDGTLVFAFKRAISKALSMANGAICISKSVCRDLDKLVKAGVLDSRSGLRIDHFYLGADFSNSAASEIVTDSWPEGLWSDARVFLMVGTVEPRKGHAFVLDAFEMRWAQGKNDKLLIIGKMGWKTDAVKKQIMESPEFGKRLFILNNVSDADLAEAYTRAYACVIASAVEGFGLPLIEAMKKGVPVLASDIPVFREIGDGYADYFPLENPGTLSDLIDNLIGNYVAARERVANFRWISWKDSVRDLVGVILRHEKIGG